MRRPSLDQLAIAVLLCALLLATFYAGVLYEGRRVARAAATEMQDQQRRHARAVAWLRGERTLAESGLRAEIATLKDQLTTEQGKADEDHRTHIDGLRAGTVSVRVPVVPASCQPAGVQPPGVPGAGPAAESAELDPAAAADLAAIPHEGDAAIRQLNYCISRYNAVRSTFTRWLQTLQQADGHDQTR